MARKRICVLTVYPEGEYQQKLLPGIFEQCNKYNYDVAVVTPLVQVCSSNQDYLKGELNIFELVNFDLFDGVIVTPVPLTEGNVSHVSEMVLKKLQKDCKIPVVSIDMKLGDYPVVFTDDSDAFFHITEHLILKHNCKDFLILSGDNQESFIIKQRHQGIFNAFQKYNISFDENKIIQGDFWYDSGELLGNSLIRNEIKMPDAVICLSDYMAIGLTNYLIKHGKRVPQDVIVTGYDAIYDASANNPPITTYDSDIAHTGAKAVNFLHQKIDKNKEEVACAGAGSENLCIGGTCGCPEDFHFTRERLKKLHLGVRSHYGIIKESKVSMGMLMESYMMENLTEAVTPFDCLAKIYEFRYLIRPFGDFYICLNEDWMDNSLDICEGYSNTMQYVLVSRRNEETSSARKHVFVEKTASNSFSVKRMLPEMINGYGIPQVYYFVPIHFGTISLGYAVVQNDLSNPYSIGIVLRNFLRNVNNALEMVRVKYQTFYLSEHDIMTDLYNRRGMRRVLMDMQKKLKKDDVVFAIVIDMDGLKSRNDNYGHLEGDNGIIYISEAVKSITDENEIAVRGGGDEFFIVGAGQYDDAKMREKFARFCYYLETKNEKLDIPVSASFGYALGNDIENDFQVILERADENMYQNKALKKKQLHEDIK